MGDGVLAATVGMGHGSEDVEDVLRGGGGRCVCVRAGEGPGVVEDVGEVVVGKGTGAVDADVDGGTAVLGAEVVVAVLLDAVMVGVDGLATASPSSPRRRLVPLDVLSFRPSEVALIRIWCLRKRVCQ
jgi:hypothetical protein